MSNDSSNQITAYKFKSTNCPQRNENEAPVERQAASKSDEEIRFFNTSFYLHLPFSVPVGTFFVFKFANFTKRANCSTDYE